MFAIANKAEEHSPWASIIINAPSQPHVVFVIEAATTRPICPTEE